MYLILELWYFIHVYNVSGHRYLMHLKLDLYMYGMKSRGVLRAYQDECKLAGKHDPSRYATGI